MQIPFMCVLEYTLTHNDCLATVGVCVFHALASAGAFFILRRYLWKTVYPKSYASLVTKNLHIKYLICEYPAAKIENIFAVHIAAKKTAQQLRVAG